MFRTISLLTTMLLLLGSTVAQGRPGKIKVLGPAKGHEATVLVSWFTTEPSTDAVVIPCRSDVWAGGGDIRRYMRIYFPRNYEGLLQYEFIILAQADLSFFTDQQQRWMYDAFGEGERGGVNTRSVMSALSPYNELWRDSPISRAFPNDVEAVLADTSDGASGPIVILDDPALPDIMRSFKAMIEPIFTTYGGLVTWPRPGSVVLSYIGDRRWTGPPAPGQVAHVFYWDWNRSKTFTFEDMVTWDFWKGRQRWNPYALDIIAGIVWFSTGRDLPPEPLRVHELRMSLYNFRLRRSILISLLDFAEAFGANPSSVYAELDLVDNMVKEAEDLYLEWEFNAAADGALDASRDLERLEGEASDLRKRALFWIFLLEWLATLGALIGAGTILWSIMVRRRLYREVRTTRGRVR